MDTQGQIGVRLLKLILDITFTDGVKPVLLGIGNLVIIILNWDGLHPLLLGSLLWTFIFLILELLVDSFPLA